MALSASSLKAAMKSAVDAIDYESGAISNDDILQAIADAIITEIIENAEVVVASGSSAGTYPVV